MGFVHRVTNWGAELGLRTKLVLVISVLALPVVALVVLQYVERSGDIEAANKEADSLEYTRVVVSLLHDVQRHRIAAAARAAGDASQQAAEEESRTAVTSGIKSLKAIDAQHSGWDTAALVASVSDLWDRISSGREAITAEAGISAHNRLVDEAVLPLLFRVGNNGGLYLDPEITTLNTIMGLSQELVAQAEAASRATAYAAVIAANRAAGEQTGVALRALLVSQTEVMNARGESARRWLQGAMDEDARYAEKLEPRIADANAGIAALAEKADAVTTFAGLSVSSTDVAALGEAALAANFNLFDAGSDLVAADLDSRSTAASLDLLAAVALGLAALALGLILATVVARSILKPINRLVVIADRMSLGELDVEFDVSSKNEVGRLAESLQRMQMSLRGAIERLRAARRVA